MKLLLVALNAKYIHSALALYCLRAYAKAFQDHITIAEYTINHQEDFILQEIYKQQPDVVCFSCYLWNIGQIRRLADNLKKLLPHVLLVLGGPEVSYDAVSALKEIPADIVLRGEGEVTFYELTKGLVTNTLSLPNIDGITYRQNGKIYQTPDRAPMALDDLPFVYENLDGFSHRILYYETQRGCPYQCQYCLSSLEKGVRFLSPQRVEQDLQFFLDHAVPQVKFVDRTFNANPVHAKHIWQYLIDHDNGVTNFHMEITADILDAESIALLKQARKGLFQFEIGVQSTNEKTIEAIRRNTSFSKLKKVVQQIHEGHNIHQHLDLIAGLPYEDYASFRQSFNDVYALQPEQFQLGFLKLLKGSGLRRDAEQYGIVYRQDAVYEVLYTKELSYSEICRLKAVEEMVETYYNSGKARTTIAYAQRFFETPFDFYEALGDDWVAENHHAVHHNKMELYTILYGFIQKTPCLQGEIAALRDCLKADIFLGDYVKTLPTFLLEAPEEKEKRWQHFHQEAMLWENIPDLQGIPAKQLAKRCYIGFFTYNVFPLLTDAKAPLEQRQTTILFDYGKRQKVTGNYPAYVLE